MTLAQALMQQFKVLDDYWDLKHDDELGNLLSELNPTYNRYNESVADTADPVVWDDWVVAVRKITSSMDISEEEATRAMITLMKEYTEHQGFELQETIKYLENRLLSNQ